MAGVGWVVLTHGHDMVGWPLVVMRWLGDPCSQPGSITTIMRSSLDGPTGSHDMVGRPLLVLMRRLGGPCSQLGSIHHHHHKMVGLSLPMAVRSLGGPFSWPCPHGSGMVGWSLLTAKFHHLHQ